MSYNPTRCQATLQNNYHHPFLQMESNTHRIKILVQSQHLVSFRTGSGNLINFAREMREIFDTSCGSSQNRLCWNYHLIVPNAKVALHIIFPLGS
jgi:hypothetical protein